jgi:AraC-like DNA-binding protein
MDTIEWPLGMAAPPSVSLIGVSLHGSGRNEYTVWPSWCLHLFRYEGELRIGDRTFPILPGSISVTPAGTTFAHRSFREDSVHLYCHFQPAVGGLPVMAAPVMQDLGRRFDRVYEAMLEGVGWFPTRPQRTEARLWDTLWEIVRPPDEEGRQWRHPAIERALQLIEQRLSQRISIERLAEESGVSHNHLIRLFRAAFSSTISQYIRRRRSERAAYLLTSSSMSIGAIAAQVGATDLQHLNKLLRATYGRGPRQIRQFGPR